MAASILRGLAALVILLPIRGDPPARAASVQAATFRITNDNSSATDERIAVFGQMFPARTVRPKETVAVTLNGVPTAAQMEAKAYYPDGSVRHAVMAVRTPRMSARATLNGTISSGAPGASQPAPVTSARTPAVQVDLTFQAGPDKGRIVHIDLSTLATTRASRRGAPWLNGPLVREQRYASELFNGVQVVFDVRTPVVGPARVDVVFHNDSAQNPTIATQTYDAAISLDGKPVYTASAVQHYTYSNWRRTLVTDGTLPPRITPDIGLLTTTGAVPRYATVTPDPQATAALHAVATRNDRPLGTGSVTTYMPTTGGRADIGPLPAWGAFYLMDPSRRNLETVLANADAAGSAPWHVRDMRTDGPIDINRYPDVWLDGRGQAVPGILDRKYYTLDTKWQPDDAHQPSLSYLAYLLTGSAYYRDELAMQAGYNLAAFDPHYRGRSAGLFLGLQVRGLAWNLRTLANAAFILPKGDLQAYFQSKLEANLREIVRRYVKGHELDDAGELRGYVPGPYQVEGSVPPWQQDYLVIVLGWIDAMGFEDAKPIITWMTNFIAGRFTNGAAGYDPIYGTPYYLYVADPHSKALLNTWAAAFAWTFNPREKPVKSLDYPDWGGGYAALARAALASIINATGSEQAKTAYAFVAAHTRAMPANYAKTPAFAITPAP